MSSQHTQTSLEMNVVDCNALVEPLDEKLSCTASNIIETENQY